MAKWVCGICGYVYEGEELPADFKCPVCKAPASKFTKQEGEMVWAAEHVVGITKMCRKRLRQDFARTLLANALKLECIWQ